MWLFSISKSLCLAFYQSSIKILLHRVCVWKPSLSGLVKKTSGSVGKNALLLSQTPLSPAERQRHEYSSVEALRQNREIKGPCFTSLDFPFLFFPLVCVFLAAAAITTERAEWQNSLHTGINEPLPSHAFKWLSNDEKQRKTVPALCAKNVLYQNVYISVSEFDITAEIFYICISLPWATQTRSQIWPCESYCTSPASSFSLWSPGCECVGFADCVWSLFNKACCRSLVRALNKLQVFSMQLVMHC